MGRMKEGRSAFKISTGKATGKRTLGKHRRRRENNIKIDFLKQVSMQELGLFSSGQGLFENTCESGFHKSWS